MVEPVVFNYAEVSITGRKRAHWTNITLPEDWEMVRYGFSKLDADAYMDEGRTQVKVTQDERKTVRPVTGSWGGSDDNPDQSTSTGRPIEVRSVGATGEEVINYDLRPEEAEGIHYPRIGYTAAQGVTAKQRLELIGHKWDIGPISMLMRF